MLEINLVKEERKKLTLISDPKKALTDSFQRTQQLIDYAHKRGVRVVPELEQPGHASFLWPLRGESAEGLEFCSANTEDKTGAQLLDDPKGNARKVLFGVLEEFAPLFPEATFHIGGDELNPACWNATQV